MNKLREDSRALRIRERMLRDACKEKALSVGKGSMKGFKCRLELERDKKSVGRDKGLRIRKRAMTTVSRSADKGFGSSGKENGEIK